MSTEYSRENGRDIFYFFFIFLGLGTFVFVSNCGGAVDRAVE